MISGVTCDLVGFMTSNNYTHCQESTTHDQMAGFSYIGDHDSVVEASSIQIEKNLHFKFALTPFTSHPAF